MLGLLHAAFPLERKRLGDDRNGERAQFAGEIRNDRRGAAACAAAQPGGYENHVGAVERFQDFFGVFERGFAAYFGVGARPQPFRQFGAELQLHRRLRKLERLQIGVRGNEFDALHLGPYHAVDGVRTAASYTDYFNLGAVLRFFAE